MNSRTLARIAGLAGLAFVLGGTLVEAIFPAPVEPGGTPAAIVAAGQNPDAWRTVTVLSMTTGLGTLFLVLFAGALGRYLDRENGLLAQLAMLGAFGAFLLSIIRRGLIIAYVQVAGGSDPSGAVAFYIASTDSLVRIYTFPIALFVWSMAALVLVSRALPAWIGWTGAVIGVLSIAGFLFGGLDPTLDLGFPVYLLMLVWILATSVVLLVRSRRPAEQPESNGSPSIPSNAA